MAFQCEEELEITEDRLNEIGIFGTWEIADETMNNISDMLPKCCQFFEFYPDNNEEDLMGLFTYTDSMGHIYDGQFTLDQTNQLLILDRMDREQLISGFDLDDSRQYLTLTFSEDNVTYIQGWVKID